MASAVDLSTIFSEFGFDITPEIVGRCVDLTSSYDIDDAREFVETYVAFSVSHMNGAEPTLQTLADFERRELNSIKSKPKETATRKHTNVAEQDAEMEDDDIMDSYICRTPKAKKVQAHILNTPDATVTFSPSTKKTADSPSSSLSKDVSGKVVYTFGSSALIKRIDWSTTSRQKLKITQIGQQTKAPNKYGFEDHYLFDALLTKCEIFADRIYDIGKDICAKLITSRPDEFTEDIYDNLSHADVPNQAVLRSFGRICSDNDCPLDKNTTFLCGADEMKLRMVQMNFSRMQSYSLFPGQTVLVQGTNPRGTTLFVDQIFSEIELKSADPPKVQDNMQFVVVAGPYTSPDDLTYGPLRDIISYCDQNKPDVLIMMGPFLDAEHKCVQDGSVRKSFEDFFGDLMNELMSAIGTEMEVIVVSSHKDAHSSFVYPTYAYNIQKTYPNLHLLPDPCKLRINNVTIGLSSTDIMGHIQEFELAENAGDKIRRSFNYLLHQRSFYPLNPPPEDVAVDSELVKNHANLDFVPNVMILPSSMKCFIRDLNNCLVLNPGQLTMYGSENTRGTFGRLVITPTDDYKTLNSFMAGQIIKI